MNAAKNQREVILLIGSNIQPFEHIARVHLLISAAFQVQRVSSVWETEPYKSGGDHFLNQAVGIQTALSCVQLHSQLRKFELQLGRHRTDDPYAPRTMDLDIIVDGEEVLDSALWEREFIAVPVAQLLPQLRNPLTGEYLSQTADRLQKQSWMREHPAIYSG